MCEKGMDWALFGTVLFGLAMFGLAYNALIHYLGERKTGYTSLFVVGGTLITLGGVALIDWRSALIGLACFAASGLAMVLGEMYRTISQRERALRAQRDEIAKMAHDDPA